MKQVLLIDDDKLFHESFRATIETEEIACFFAINSSDARKILEDESIQLIFLDLDLGKEYGLDVIEKLSAFSVPICILSGTASIHTTVKALKLGAVDVFEKPISKSEIQELIENYSLLSLPKKDEFLWKSKAMQEIESMVLSISTSNAKILLRGESGTGKEVLARRIHQESNRRENAFIAVNCGAIPENLIENELFGSRKGAFTGSDKDHKGLIRSADKGTLFLDEIAEIPLPLQVKLLRFIQEGEIHPIGSDHSETVDVRIIAATHRNLEKMLEEQLFREDLYFRINVFTIDIPALRDRMDDFELLLDSLIEKFMLEYKNKLMFSKEAIDCLKQYEWKGNIRELSNLVERLMLTVFHPVKVSDLPKNFQISTDRAEPPKPETSRSLKEARENFERKYILSAMDDSSSLKELSERLQIERTTLYKKLRYLGIKSD